VPSDPSPTQSQKAHETEATGATSPSLSSLSVAAEKIDAGPTPALP